jgi:hypothetical protein
MLNKPKKKVSDWLLCGYEEFCHTLNFRMNLSWMKRRDPTEVGRSRLVLRMTTNSGF